MSISLAPIIGGAAGAVALVGISILLIWLCLFRQTSVSRTSETGSSDPSQVGRHGGMESQMRDTRRFAMEELSHATKNFSDKNLIGEGKFGEVYKGLLQDGMLVAIKKRHAATSQEFVDEVRYLSAIQHRNLVTLIGYCQENNLQFLIYEYVPNGSVSSHLYGATQQPREKLEFKHRLSIAQGAAKGLAHLHSLSPRLVHKNFKTSNVLVDENFISKVADAGLRNFLGRVDIAGSSSQVASDEIFLAPEVREFRQFSDKSDVYSFGVFLLELLSGKEATESPSINTSQNLVESVLSNQDSSIMSAIIDQRMESRFTAEGMENYILLLIRCLDPSSERRPAMSYVEMELDRILEKEMNLTTMMGEGTPTVTLGSQLFKSTK
ncbi:putative serine/threonine-protein kinase isoform X2 [Trifolium pratense]|uniref:putative serine/threonine-protein kinase isoform X2 n=1 Tax=Trifolium pratense TaxID=57577 RepID=UPI001E6957BC|nr:putative serine/threonine-protein kinase isoform X2 [Trifolium pratense]XP_045793713.1 putative serine/threonine-protein kinase isoform X2 [Trifolium pratense]XP_045793714.1 putative serine/threonine-protein kinase isoform X2 [Trifolium pratense]XP_045793715.1 putative serine/threonine-protein kinase isoform X2 [Trifolium pratense]XP_045793716.1 putative serine/threonine-protein kinase isoform X2 [Trifolium pratense]XP_045793717.1 putative serine/threonine-protein kinase isoform X2 [Trifoli